MRFDFGIVLLLLLLLPLLLARPAHNSGWAVGVGSWKNSREPEACRKHPAASCYNRVLEQRRQKWGLGCMAVHGANKLTYGT